MLVAALLVMWMHLDAGQCQEQVQQAQQQQAGLRFPNLFGLNNAFSLSNIFRPQKPNLALATGPRPPRPPPFHQQQQQLSPAGPNPFLRVPPPTAVALPPPLPPSPPSAPFPSLFQHSQGSVTLFIFDLF